jgi:hypothetical protein
MVTILVLMLSAFGAAAGGLAYARARGAMAECLGMLARQTASAGGVDVRAIRDFAVCRYDALDEMSGRMSFSIALINGLGDGLVITSINGRSETRTYARPVRGGRGVQQLTPEEEQAVRMARLGLGPDVMLASSAKAGTGKTRDRCP